MKNKTNKDSTVSAYGFACGHVQSYEQPYNRKEQPSNHRLEMYKEHGTFHIKMFLGDTSGLEYSAFGCKQWHSFDNLTFARRCYKRLEKGMKGLGFWEIVNDSKKYF